VTSWIEPFLALLTSLACVLFAFRSRVPRWSWMFVGIAGLAVALALANGIPRRVNGYLLSAAVPLITVPFFTFELTRMSRSGLVIATVLATSYSGWMEFFAPALAREELASLQTRFSREGICLQTTEYTCGPAAAVTVLAHLGFKAEEGDLALRANCSPHTGTDPSDLAGAIDERFGMMGAWVEYRPLDTLEELQKAGLALTVIKFDSMLDHWVAVLKVDAYHVHYADPARGLRIERRADFERKWEHETIRVWRQWQWTGTHKRPASRG
jgi:predicted double-glycine peptidase